MKSKFTVFVRSFWVMLTIFFALLLAFCIAGASVANSYAGSINDLMGINPYKKVQSADSGDSDMEYFKSDYVQKDEAGNILTQTDVDEETGGRYTHQVYDHKAMRAESERVAEQTAVEGSVLLWNDEIEGGEKALPLASDASVSLFGIASREYTFLGQGSGAMETRAVGESLYSALEDKGLNVNYDLYRRYNELSASNSSYGSELKGIDTWQYTNFRVGEVPWSEIEDTVALSVNDANHCDAAVMVITRNAGEDQDIKARADGSNMPDDYVDGTKNYLELTREEADVLRNLAALKDAGDVGRVVLLINSPNPMQFANIVKDEYGIDACLWVGMGGNLSFVAIADALTDTGYAVSGRTPDTLVYDNRSAPSYENFGDFTWTDWSDELPDLGKENGGRFFTHNTKYLVYSEGVYVGYRYYETRYEDYVLGGGNAGESAGATDGSGWSYAEEVAFPFGYGLGYTEFTRSEPTFAETDDGISLSVTVSNSGDRAGKDVVQVYMQRPYTVYDGKHGIEKPAVELVGFVKTDMLYPESEAGEGKPNSQTVTVIVDEENFRTYDAYGEGTYILEAGTYYLTLATDSHDAVNNILAKKGHSPANTGGRMDAEGDAGMVYEKRVAKDDFEIYAESADTGEPIVNRLSDADLNLYEGTADQKITYLSRSDWDGTYPEPAELECTNEIMVRDMQYGHEVPVEEGDRMPVYGTVTAPEGELTLAMFFELEYDDPKWEDLLNQMTYAEQCLMISQGLRVMNGAESIAAPGMIARDGPGGVKEKNPDPDINSQMCFPSEVVMAATWNAPLIEELGVAFGHEALHAGVYEVYAPGANIHRSPYGGRNWEYFSEDGVLSGVMLCAEIKGIQSKGIIVMTKHFAINDQETNRYAVATFFNEQTAREVYLRPFEIAIRQGDMNGVMTSFNRIGCTWAGVHKGLLTGILRDEWDFTGICETDSSSSVAHMTGTPEVRAEAVVAGTDMWLDGSEDDDWMNGSKDNPTVMLAVREACHRIIYNQLHSAAMNGMDSSTRMVRITAWWQYALVAVQIVVGVLTAAALAMAVISFIVVAKKNKKAAPAYAAARTPSQGNDGKTAENVRPYADNGREDDGAPAPSGGEPPESGGRSRFAEWLTKHRKLLVAIGSAVIAAIVIVAIVVPVTTCGGGTDEPAPGPGPEPPPVTETHECEHKCPVCGGCLDLECEDEACAVKCGAGKTGHSYEAENALREGGDNGYMSVVTGANGTYVNNVYGNAGARISFTVTVESDVTASLSVTMTGAAQTTVFTDEMRTTVVDAAGTRTHFESPAEAPHATSERFGEVMLGCVSLKAGENTITFEAVDFIELKSGANNDHGYHIDKITLYGDGLSADEHECGSVCPVCGKCTDLDCEDPVCAEKCGDEYESEHYRLEAETAKFGEGVNGLPKVESNGTHVGNFSENEGASLTFTFDADKAGKATLYVGSSYRNVERLFTDGFNVYVNNWSEDPELRGEPLVSPTTVPASNVVGGNWNEWLKTAHIALGCVDLVEGENTIVLEVKSDNTNTAFNLDYIELATDSVITTEEACSEICAVCGKCMDDSCADAEHADKCAGHDYGEMLGTSAIFGAGSKGAPRAETNSAAPEGLVGNISENLGASLTFRFRSSVTDKATLTAYVTQREIEQRFGEFLTVTVNGAVLETNAVVAATDTGKADWYNTVPVVLGEIDLTAGEVCEITFTVAVSSRTVGFNFGAIEIEAVSEHTHRLTSVAAVPETCTTAGRKAYWECSGCGLIFADAEGNTETTLEELAVDALGHDYELKAEVKSGTYVAGDTISADDVTYSLVCSRGDDEKAVTATADLSAPLEAGANEFTATYAEGEKRYEVTFTVTAQEPGHVHAPVYVDPVASSAQSAGNIGYYRCDCGKLFLDEDCEREITQADTVLPAWSDFSVMSDDVVVTDSNGGSVSKNTGEQNLSATNHGAGYNKYIVTYNIWSSCAADAVLSLRLSARPDEVKLSDVYAIYVNGKRADTAGAMMPVSDPIAWGNAGAASVNISLAAGNNVIRIERLNLDALYGSDARGDYTYNFYGIVLAPGANADLVSHTCAEVCEYCGKCASDTCNVGMCEDKCVCDETAHVCARDCESVCEICGLCNDADCADGNCTEKCDGEVYTVADGEALTADGTPVGLQSDGAISCNDSAAKYGEYTVTYRITPETDMTVGLYIRTTSQRIDNLLKDMYGVKVNGAEVAIADDTYMPYNDKDMWNDIRYTYVGEITLEAGTENTIEIVRYDRNELTGNMKEFTGYNFFGIALEKA